MSLRAMLWALEDAPVNDTSALVILWALADRASDDGRSAYPSVEWIADRARCSTRTVHRHLRTLEQDGLISRGDQQIVAHFRADHRPVVWDLNLSARRGDNLSRRDTRDAHGVTPVTERGDTVVTQTVPLPTGETVPVTVPSSGPSSEPAILGIAFDQFWSIYPRKVGKEAARKAWMKACRKTAPLTILAGAERYRDDRTRVPQYTAHPTTWLNAGRWADEDVARPESLVEADRRSGTQWTHGMDFMGGAGS